MRIDSLETGVFVIPTDGPEADGTLSWDSTTMIVVEAVAGGGLRGLGYTYGARAAAGVVHEKLAAIVRGRHAHDVRAIWSDLVDACRNLGLPGIAATAVAAVDAALWDLHAKEAGLPLHRLLGARRDEVPIYGSGGFTSYGDDRLAEQLAGWAAAGIPRVKMKIGVDRGARPQEDLRRIALARDAVGSEAALFVDANGAFSAKQVLELTPALAELGVTYFEEPVSSDRLDQLALLRRQVPYDVAAGEYAWAPWHCAALLQAGAVDVLQADASRCCGITGWLMAADLAAAAGTAFSGHCCPALHLHAACAAPEIAHLEYFWDHTRIEGMLFDGAPAPTAHGTLRPDAERPGLGLELKRRDAARYAA